MFLLEKSKYDLVNKLYPYIREKVVIQGVLHGNNRGKVFVDSVESPQAILIWATNEMFYFIGKPSTVFIDSVENFIHTVIKKEALDIGEDCFNLEVYPFHDWEPYIDTIFKVTNVQQGK